MAKYSDKTYVSTVRDTADNITHEKPFEISDKIWMTKPNRNRALGYQLSQSEKESSMERTFWHLEDAANPITVKYNGDDEAAQAATGLVFTSATGVRITEGSRVYFPRSKEILRLNAEMASSTTSGAVNRNFGLGSATCYLKKGDIGLVLPPAMYEGFTTGPGLASTLYQKSFNMTEFSYPVKVTYIENNETHRGGKPFQRELRKRIIEAKDKLELEMFFGAHVADTTTFDHPIGAATGYENYITSHVFNIPKISRMDFFDILTLWTEWNPEGGVIFASSSFVSMVTQWAFNKTTITMGPGGQQGEGKLGMSIGRVQWSVGTFDIIPVWCLGLTQDVRGKAFFIPAGHYKYRYLQNLDSQYNPINRDEVHSDEGEIYGTCGHEFFEEELHMRIDGLEF